MTIREITVDELAALGADAHVVDVREDHEWAEAHVAHAVHVPLATVPDSLDRFDGAPTYLICRSGGRSLHACEFLAARGHDVVNVSGGMIAWVGANHPGEIVAAGGPGG